MHHFNYVDGRLHCEGVSLEEIANQVGTPTYVYSTATLERHYKVLSEAFEGSKYLIAYSVKACGNIGVVATLAKLGAGADVVSGGELAKALHAGIPAEKIVFSGVGKTRSELTAALEAGIHQFNVESFPEMERLNEIAIDLGKVAPIAFRVNPHVDAGGHANISTGGAEHKFGIAWHEAAEMYAKANAMEGINPIAVDVHIGSQIMDVEPMRIAFEKVVTLVRELREQGIDIQRMDLGGGLGIPYSPEDNPDSPAKYAQMIREVKQGVDVQLILEPGRMIAGNAGVMLANVEYIKERDGRKFVILDSGMNDLARPALYDSIHEVSPLVEPAEGAELKPVDLVGPVCETTDRFEEARPMPELKQDDKIAFMSAGAYGAVLSSQYNARPLAAEVLVNGDSFSVIRPRPSYEDIIALEKQPDWLK